MIELLQRECGLNEASIVADVGCGTGLLAELFLREGNTVYGIEPNREMREAAAAYLEEYPRLRLKKGTAEATGLPDNSTDFVVVGQAFHWFDPPAAYREFQRILRRDGWVVIVWNFRRESATPLMEGYERILGRYGSDYLEVHRRQKDTGALLSVFGEKFFMRRSFFWDHQLDASGFKDRLLSSSYVPSPDSVRGSEMLDEARALFFDEQEESGRVLMKYETIVYFGRFI